MKRLWLTPIAAALAATLFWALAQPSPQPIATVFPAGALLYLEAKDFNALLADWNRSTEKRDWLPSANYEAFSRSTLFLKLGDAQTQFSTAAGIPPDYALLASVAGSNSAAALYDIGKLEFLYVTHLPSARAINTSLWKTRASFQTRHAGNADYFIKEDKTLHRVAAFAYVGDSLLLSTREDLLAGALQLLARESQRSVASEPWFTDSVQASGPNQGDLRLIYNMTALARTPHVRSYWVQANVPDLRQFSSGLADLTRAAGEINERRVLLRANPEPPQSQAMTDETPTGQLLAAVPDDAAFYRAWLHPAPGQPAQLIEEKLFPSAIASAAPRSKFAPTVANTPDAGSEIDLESRIDEPPPAAARDPLQSLRDHLTAATIDAMLEVSLTKLDPAQVFVRPHSAIVLLGNAPWNADAIRAATSALETIPKIAVAIDGKWLVLGNDSDLVTAIFARRTRPALPGANYAAQWRHARELPNFEKMTAQIDFPQAQGTEPPFFSANLASLARALKPVGTVTIVTHDTGAQLRESVVYKLTP
jgi:hypothetical protein